MAPRKRNSNGTNAQPPEDPKNLSDYGKKFEVAVAAYDDAPTIRQATASCGVNTPSSSLRGNIAASIPPTAQFTNIFENSVAPYPYGSAASLNGGYGYNWGNYGAVWINLAIQLVQAAYTHIPKVTSTINLLTELCVGQITLKGGTAQSRSFYKNWFDKINLFNLQDQYYLEDWRSGNVFYYKLQTTLNSSNVKDFNQAFGSNAKSGKKLTIKYLLLNPAYIGVNGIVSFVNPTYYIILNSFTLNNLFSDPSDSTRKLIESVPELKEVATKYKKSSKNGANGLNGLMAVNLPLTPDHVVTVFSHKQDYEALSVPVFYGLMPLLNQQLELLKLDQQINRQVLRATLLITMGDKELGAPSPRQISNMQSLFASDSIAQVIVGDYTIKGEWLVPNIGELFDPKKYDQLNKMIEDGFGNVLTGDAKFSTLSAKLDLFAQKINYHRKVFLERFLIPQMENIADEFGFKSIPIPEYAPLRIKDDATRARILAQMAQLGLLTDSELIEALETGILPDPSESEENQTKYKQLRDKGLYAPLLGKPNDGGDGGRPAGSGTPQKTKNPKPAGSVGASYKSSPQSLKEVMLLATDLERKVEAVTKKQYNLKKLTAEQKELVGSMIEQIVVNEPKDKWNDKISEYLDFDNKIQPTEINKNIRELAANFNLNHYSAALFYHSLFEVKEKS